MVGAVGGARDGFSLRDEPILQIRGSERRGHVEAVDALFAAGDFTGLFGVEDDVWARWRRR